MLPHEIPRALRRSAVRPEAARRNEAAWSKREALRVIDALESTKVAVVGVQRYRADATGLIPTEENWSCTRQLGELATTFARISRSAARRYVAETDDDRVDLVALEFSPQNDAA